MTTAASLAAAYFLFALLGTLMPYPVVLNALLLLWSPGFCAC